MKLILFLVLLFGLSSSLDLQKKLSDFGGKTQMICQEMLPASSKQKDTLGSMVCGKKVTDPQQLNFLQASGLVHLFVVSGGHLNLFVTLLQNRASLFFWLVLLGFTLMTGFQAPCVRSLAQLGISTHQRSRCPSHRPDQKILFCGLVCLALFPDWIRSLSLQLSWTASLALSTTENSSKTGFHKALITGAWIYLLMLPLLWPLSSLSPTSIPWNLILGSAIAFFLFPLALFSCCYSWALSSYDFLLSRFWELNVFIENSTRPPEFQKIQFAFGWLWIFFCHFAIHFFLVTTLRKNRT